MRACNTERTEKLTLPDSKELCYFRAYNKIIEEESCSFGPDGTRISSKIEIIYSRASKRNRDKKKGKKEKTVVASIERAKFKWESNNRKQIVRFIFRTNTDRSRGGASTKLDKIGGSNSFSTRGVELIIKRDTGIL